MSDLMWSPDGKLVAGFFINSVGVWNPQRMQQPLHFFSNDDLHYIRGLAWSPDSTCLAFGNNHGEVRVWDAYQGGLKRTLRRHDGSVWPIAWSPDGKLLASGSSEPDFSVLIWDPWKKDRPLCRLRGHTHTVRGLTWSPDSTLLASGSLDGTVRIWNPQKNHQRPKILRFSSRDFGALDPRGDQGLVQWSPNGEMLASLHGGKVRIWNPDENYPLQIIGDGTYQICSMAWSPTIVYLAFGCNDGRIRVWDPYRDRPQQVLEGHKGHDISTVVWSPDGMLLASSNSRQRVPSDSSTSANTDVFVWDTKTWERFARFEGHSKVAWHPSDARILVTLGPQGRGLSIWNLTHLPQGVHSQQTVHYRTAKVVLVGEGGVGKSGLARALTGQPFKATELTHGRDVWQLDQQEVPLESGVLEQRETHLWDLAGQEHYRLIHQLHLHEATVALIVFNATKEADAFDSIRYWHRALLLAQQARGSNALPLAIGLVAARIDEANRRVNQAHINILVQELCCAGYIETSAKENWNITKLKENILGSIKWEQLPGVTSTPQLQAIRNFIWDEKHAKHLLRSRAELFEAFLRTQNTSISTSEWSQQFENMLRSLETQGNIRELGFGNLILLQPELLDAYASALLSAVKDKSDGLGCISEERVRQGQFPIPQEKRLDNGVQEQLLLIAMIEELVRHELVLREGGSLLFPSQSTHEHPDYATLANKQSVTFTFAGPVLSIYTKLVVRLAQCSTFQKQGLWQHVVIYMTPLGGKYGLLLSLQSEERAKLGIFFEESTREEMRFLFEHFVQAHLERHTGETLQRQRQYVCPTCSEAFTKKQVNSRRGRGFTSIRCNICETEVSLLDGKERLAATTVSLVEEMEQEADDERKRASVETNRRGEVVVQETNRQRLRNGERASFHINIYISSASTPKDEALLKELEKQLSVLKLQLNTYIWQKRLILPGANCAQEISTYVNDAHLILFLVSPDFLASDQCYEEMELAIERMDSGTVSVIPVILRPTANWQETPIGRLQPLPTDREPISSQADPERAMRDAAESIWHTVEQIRQNLSDTNS